MRAKRLKLRLVMAGVTVALMCSLRLGLAGSQEPGKGRRNDVVASKASKELAPGAKDSLSRRLVDVIQHAGGFLSSAELKDIRLIGPGGNGKPSRVFRVDYEAIRERGGCCGRQAGRSLRQRLPPGFGCEWQSEKPDQEHRAHRDPGITHRLGKAAEDPAREQALDRRPGRRDEPADVVAK
jgi:hypothetical protein